MEIKEIADGEITLAIESGEAIDIAGACTLVLEAPYSGEADKDRLYRMYRALFEALAVAAHGQYSIVDKKEQAAARLTALRAMQRQRGE